MRFVLGLPPRSHVGQDEINKIKFLNIEDRINQLCLNHIFKVRAGSSPYYFKEMFTEVSNVHKFNTRRSSHDYIVPFVKGLNYGIIYPMRSRAFQDICRTSKG